MLARTLNRVRRSSNKRVQTVNKRCYAYDASNKAHQTIHDKVTNNKLVLFMKGNPEQPRCGFSKAAVDTLNREETQFEHVDVLQDSEIREAIKQYSDWPTIPQAYLNGEFIGGCDILMSLSREGDLAEMLKKEK
eukprot:TRINITY_DN11752_c0_g1_i1.p1 TRINITY_DN11752_c0_g1~~TRINITY_DN11752_c0_g1_i1.p1  ORF type:complete len:134 (-),score=25.89 TRINITY_DN11752_c0_g1_i1:26-427(-)